MNKEYIILVAQIVINKYRFPHNVVGKFQRFKPWPYIDSSQEHKIIYAKRFIDTETNANAHSKRVSHEFFKDYYMNINNIRHVCISEFTILFHNVSDNISTQLLTTYNDNESKNQSFLFPNIYCNNKNLGDWGIIKGLT